MWFGHMGNFSWGGMLLGGLVMLIFWGGLIAITVVAVRAVWGSGADKQAPPPELDHEPLKIAQKRYARGDITRDEFLEIKRDLE
jgi:putative membrane protein